MVPCYKAFSFHPLQKERVTCSQGQIPEWCKSVGIVPGCSKPGGGLWTILEVSLFLSWQGVGEGHVWSKSVEKGPNKGPLLEQAEEW